LARANGELAELIIFKNLKYTFTKISFFILIALLFSNCSSTKRVAAGKLLLVKNEITVNGTATKKEEIINLPVQKPNTTLLGFRFRLKMYGMANLNPDSTYQAKFIKNPEKYKRKSAWLSKKQVDRLGKSFWYHGWHDFLKKTGEPPVVLDKIKTQKTILRLQNYYFERGFLDAKASFKIDTLAKKKVKIRYEVVTGRPYILDSIQTKIKSPVLDSIFKSHAGESFLKKQQYQKIDFDNERNRLTTLYRNNGVFYFQQNYVNYEIDTVNTNKKTNVLIKINDRNIRVNDSSKTEPFKIYKISKVNVFVDVNAIKNASIMKDSVLYKGVNLYSLGKLKYRPKAIADAVFIAKETLFNDEKTSQTKNYLSNLQDFTYPNIVYTNDNKNNSLTANIYLNQKKKYKFGLEFGATHSNIQEFGIGGNGSLLIRNLFHGAETLKIAGRANVGASKDFANPDNQFFNVSEYGLDFKLSFPRIFFPIKFEKSIPKSMIPSTNINIGLAKQRNIGLDKENITGSIVYNWTPSKSTAMRLDLLNVQYVRNINTANYFNVYKSSYDRLNQIAQQYIGVLSDPKVFENNNLNIDYGTTVFTNEVLNNPSFSISPTNFNTVRSIEERRQRLTQNDFILASSFSFTKSTRNGLDDDNFYNFKSKFESAGNFLSLLVNEKNKSEAGNNTVFGVPYSQYVKTEFEYIKHWDLRGKKVFAIRSFLGIAIPYGNSKSVPFSRSYFAGGSNDNRAWQPYSLGPGRSGSLNDFNEANMKFLTSAELRFNIFNKLNGAVFVDAGNIWNVLDNISDETSVFSSIKSLNDIAIGSGLGFRYDLTYFVIRLDLGFKTYDPAISDNKKWFRDYNYAHSVINIGINYPF
jgi:outer membrane protein assembly factor BamA